jgi:hypothetical protein
MTQLMAFMRLSDKPQIFPSLPEESAFPFTISELVIATSEEQMAIQRELYQCLEFSMIPPDTAIKAVVEEKAHLQFILNLGTQISMIFFN